MLGRPCPCARSGRPGLTPPGPAARPGQPGPAASRGRLAARRCSGAGRAASRRRARGARRRLPGPRCGQGTGPGRTAHSHRSGWPRRSGGSSTLPPRNVRYRTVPGREPPGCCGSRAQRLPRAPAPGWPPRDCPGLAGQDPADRAGRYRLLDPARRAAPRAGNPGRRLVLLTYVQILPSRRSGGSGPRLARLELAPLRGVRYVPGRVSALAEVTSPPYDVIAPGGESQLMAADPHNVVRLILPRRSPGHAGSPYREAAELLRQWLAEGILAADPAPALYVYEQAAGGEVVQRGLIGALRLSPPGDGVVLPHEEVAPGPVAGRLALMEATEANLEPIFLLYDGD